jgi:hypothetical protein
MLTDFKNIMDSIVTDILNRAGTDFVEQLKASHKAAGQVATGKTLESFGFKLEKTDYGYSLKVVGAEHVEFTDRGRGTGKGSPTDKIKEWIKAKSLESKFNIKSESSLNWVASRISKKHALEGSYQHRTGTTYNGARKPISSVFEEEKIKRLENLLTSAIISKISSTFVEQYKEKEK